MHTQPPPVCGLAPIERPNAARRRVSLRPLCGSRRWHSRAVTGACRPPVDIAIGGTHGKTTTTSITTHILKTSGIDCTAFLGGIAENFQSNFVEGKSEWFVVEADEFDRSFLHLNPQISASIERTAEI